MLELSCWMWFSEEMMVLRSSRLGEYRSSGSSCRLFLEMLMELSLEQRLRPQGSWVSWLQNHSTN